MVTIRLLPHRVDGGGGRVGRGAVCELPLPAWTAASLLHVAEAVVPRQQSGRHPLLPRKCGGFILYRHGQPSRQSTQAQTGVSQ